jgi:nicotinate-nucleotide adenylyltransferase
MVAAKEHRLISRRHSTSKKSRSLPKRIGIYAGTFNPVHAGHIAFGLQAVQAAKLDAVYFVPERQPRGKPGVEHFGHRVAMLKRATHLHPRFDVLELVDVNMSVGRTLPKLQERFRGSQLVFLFGSDVVAHIPTWPNSKRMLAEAELVVGLRNNNSEAALRQAVEAWPVGPKELAVFSSYAPDISSRHIREALYKRRPANGLLRSVERYSDRHWLYVSVA